MRRMFVKRPIIATDEIDYGGMVDEVRDKIFNELEKTFSEYSKKLHAEMPEYDPQWCEEDGTSKLAVELEAARIEFADAMAKLLVAHYDEA